MNIRSAILLPLLFWGTVLSAQFYYGGLSGRYEFPRTNFMVDSNGNIRYQPGDLGFTVEAGAMAGIDFRGHSRFGTYVSPALAYNVSPRFRIKTGVTIYQGFGDPYAGYEGVAPYSASSTTTGFFVQGDYLLSNKVTLSGAVYKYFSPVNFSDPYKKGPEGESYLFNVNYRPTRNFEINATIEYGNGRGIYRNDPWHPQSFMQPPF
jgi:hypothetical protein